MHQQPKFFANCVAPHMWVVLGGDNPTIHDTKEEAEASAKVQNERASWEAREVEAVA